MDFTWLLNFQILLASRFILSKLNIMENTRNLVCHLPFMIWENKLQLYPAKVIIEFKTCYEP